MRSVAIPPAGHSAPARSFAAAVGAILEVEGAELPVFAAGETLIADWQSWLAERGLGLVPIADPAGFMWPGPWIAVLADDVAVVAFGAPPGVLWHPLDGEQTFDTVRAGYVIAAHDMVGRDAEDARVDGRVELVAIAPAAEAPMQTVERAEAVPGRGLRGDRYFDRAGTFSTRGGNGRELTLVEAEQLDALGLIAYSDARRNVVTRGIDLNALVGKRFAIGEVECVGRRLCEPCAHLERLTVPGVLRGLVHRGGLRADLIGAGAIEVGAPVRPL
jgi:MOSC domain-containing protein YiiM